MEQDILQRNNLSAERNRGYFEAKNIFCLNLMSSPGSGKTTLLEETIKQLKGRKPVYVIEGDQQTSNDADCIASLDIPVFQVNTGTGCHLEASMINHALKHLNPKDNSILFIENVGNLVCPAMFDLGEAQKVVIVSTTEGDDKPLKYPQMFQEADICIINKIDLSPYLNTDINVLRENCLKVNHEVKMDLMSNLFESYLLSLCTGSQISYPRRTLFVISHRMDLNLRHRHDGIHNYYLLLLFYRRGTFLLLLKERIDYG